MLWGLECMGQGPCTTVLILAMRAGPWCRGEMVCCQVLTIHFTHLSSLLASGP